jgi:hypothetical protein
MALTPGFYFIYPIGEDVIIMTPPDKYILSKKVDELEELIVNNVVHPSLPKLLTLFGQNPNLVLDIAVELTNRSTDYDIIIE